MSDGPLKRSDVRRDLRIALIRVHGTVGDAHNLNELVAVALEHGLPDREERERILERKLGEPDEEVCGPHET